MAFQIKSFCGRIKVSLKQIKHLLHGKYYPILFVIIAPFIYHKNIDHYHFRVRKLRHEDVQQTSKGGSQDWHLAI